MTLLSVEELRRVVSSDLSDSDLFDLITLEELELVRRFGAHGDGAATVTEIRSGQGQELYLARPIASVTSITERRALNLADVPVTTAEYILWPAQGRITRTNAAWGPRVTVVYAPQDDRARRKQVIANLLRIGLAQSAYKSESIGGEYSYTAPESWEAERARQYRRLGLPNL